MAEKQASSPFLSVTWCQFSSSEGRRVQNRVQLLNTLHTRGLTHMLSHSSSLAV